MSVPRSHHFLTALTLLALGGDVLAGWRPERLETAGTACRATQHAMQANLEYDGTQVHNLRSDPPTLGNIAIVACPFNAIPSTSQHRLRAVRIQFSGYWPYQTYCWIEARFRSHVVSVYAHGGLGLLIPASRLPDDFDPLSLTCILYPGQRVHHFGLDYDVWDAP